MNVIVQYDPFAPVAELERRIEHLESINKALLDDQTVLCDLLADAYGKLARAEQEVARLKRGGVYHLKQPTLGIGREVVGGKR